MEVIYMFQHSEYPEGVVHQSFHKTRKGAEIAMEFHKQKEYEEWLEDNKRDPVLWDKFGEHCYWSVTEIELEN